APSRAVHGSAACSSSTTARPRSPFGPSFRTQRARARKRYKLTTMSDHDQPVAANLLDRQFAAAAPNQRWASDTTEFVIGNSGSGKLYLAAVLDLFSRFIV